MANVLLYDKSVEKSIVVRGILDQTAQNITYSENDELKKVSVQSLLKEFAQKKIDFIICDICCYWQNENLIGMTYDHFLSLIGGQCPDNEDICYVPVSRERGQNQKVYNFKSIGLQVWVWRNKIKTIIVSKETLEDE